MKHKKKEERLKKRQEDYDRNYVLEKGCTRPGSIKRN